MTSKLIEPDNKQTDLVFEGIPLQLFPNIELNII